MGLLTEACLRDAGRRAGSYLRGFDDPAFHTGSETAFCAQFRMVLALPVIRVPGETQAVSFAEALVSCAITDSIPDEGGFVNELGRLLGGPLVSDDGIRKQLSWLAVSGDIETMLTIPVMRCYVEAADVQVLEASVRRLAEGRRVRFGSDRIEVGELAEQFRPMELGCSVSCCISYSLMQALTFEPTILCYQAEAYVKAS
jgi:hypothetical protein